MSDSEKNQILANYVKKDLSKSNPEELLAITSSSELTPERKTEKLANYAKENYSLECINDIFGQAGHKLPRYHRNLALSKAASFNLFPRDHIRDLLKKKAKDISPDGSTENFHLSSQFESIVKEIIELNVTIYGDCQEFSVVFAHNYDEHKVY
jgi:hypothetical protein